MRAIIVALFFVGALFVGNVISDSNPAAADGPPKKSQWQYQCFEATGVADVTDRSNKMGQNGWELVTSAGTKGSTLWCFKRPLWKPTK